MEAIRIVTTAPAKLDEPGTVEESSRIGTDNQARTLRLVLVPADRERAQMDRYASGWHNSSREERARGERLRHIFFFQG